ncbi:MAG: hypothetical protein WCG85_04810 [Polyangia bacterium]
MSASRFLGLMIVSAWLAAGCTSPKKIDVGGTCILNSDCGGSLVCTWGICHVACHASADCPKGQSCIIASAQSTVCQGPTPCTYNSDCQAGLICAVDRQCRQQCQKNVDCTNGQTCTTTNTCAEQSQVDSNKDLLMPDGGVGGAGGTSGTGGGAGGTSGIGGAAGMGGTGTGGSISPNPDASPDLPADVPSGTGGVSSSGGIQSTAGVTSAADAPGTGGTTATGGTTKTGGSTGVGGTTNLYDAAADLNTRVDAPDAPAVLDVGTVDAGLGDAVPQEQNLMLWLNAATIKGLADGANVATWADGSGNGRNVSAAGVPPTYRVNQMNGFPIVRFDGSSDSLATASNFGLSGDPPFTVILAAKIASSNIEWGTFWAFGNNATPGGCAALDWHNSNLCLATSFNWDAYLQSGAFASYADTTSIITVRRSPGAVGTTTEILLDGATQAITGVGNTPAIVDSLFQVGAFGTVGGVTGGYRSIVDVAELLAYGIALSDADRVTLECSLGAKYNITVAGCK